MCEDVFMCMCVYTHGSIYVYVCMYDVAISEYFYAQFIEEVKIASAFSRE